jgi:hypothetical protein
MREGDLEGNLLSVIGNAGGKDLLQEAAEFSLDAVLGDGIVKDIPVVGTVAKLYGAAVGLQGYVFAKKVRRFLTELSAIPQSERDEFARRLDSDPEQRERTADVLVTLLDKMDDTAKAPLLARAFSRYVQGEFDFSTFQRLAAAVDRCLVDDLPALEKIELKLAVLDEYVGDLLVSAGLAGIRAIPTIRGPGAKTTYGLSELGELFLQVVVRGRSRSD